MFQRRTGVNSKSVKLHPFGSCMAGRGFSSAAYRYGFNGKEKETDGIADNYEFGARIYDGRLGRWLSADPMFNEDRNDGFSPYNYGINSPIYIVDRDGKIWWIAIGAAVGGVVNAGIGVVRGESLAQIGGRFVKGALIGAAITACPIVAAQAGVVGAAAVQATLYASPVIYMAGEGAGQLTRYALSRGKEKFNENEFVESVAYAIPETILDLITGGMGTIATKSIKQQLTENVVEQSLSREIEREIKKDITKQVKKDIRGSGKKLTKKELNKITDSIYKNAMESAAGKVNTKVTKIDKNIDILNVIVPPITSSIISDVVEN